MKILAIDTATEACSVALLNEGERDGMFEICPQEHSQKVLPMVDTLLTKHGLKIADLDAIAFGRGPGSFTGVRIATGIVQGLALGADLPVIEVSTLAAMAQECYEKHQAQVSKVLIDARMNEVYFGHYCITNNVATEIQPEAVLAPDEAVEKYTSAALSAITNGQHSEEACAGTGWEAYAEKTGFSRDNEIINVSFPNALYMLTIAETEFQLGHQKSVDDLVPVYLRDKVTWKKLPGRE